MDCAGKIGFIGGGNMAEALIKGLRNGREAVRDIVVFDPNEKRIDYLVKHYHIDSAASNSGLVADCAVIFLAIKPQVCEAVLREIASCLFEKKLLLSIMAGMSTSAIESHFSQPLRLVRAMPNTPALIGEGSTAICTGSHAQKADMATASRLFEAIGLVFEVQEQQMDAVTGLSGSGPAYVFSFIEALAAGGVLNGIPGDTAMTLAVQTVVGAAMLVKSSGDHPALLRDKVCSPGGTTIAGIKALEASAFRNAVMEAVSAATRRSRDLGCK